VGRRVQFPVLDFPCIDEYPKWDIQVLLENSGLVSLLPSTLLMQCFNLNYPEYWRRINQVSEWRMLALITAPLNTSLYCQFNCYSSIFKLVSNSRPTGQQGKPFPKSATDQRPTPSALQFFSPFSYSLFTGLLSILAANGRGWGRRRAATFLKLASCVSEKPVEI